MNVPGTQFRIPQEPLLSREFLQRRSSTSSQPNGNGSPARYLFFWARNAIYHSLSAAKIAPGDEVLVPSYVCKVVPEAVASHGAKVIFYRIYKDCAPDFDDLKSKIGQRTRALVTAHFFGFPQPIERLRELSSDFGLFLIEDCAHVLQSSVNGQRLGTFGDASVFSLRKFYPLYDGGELILNRAECDLDIDWCAESPLFTLKVAKDFADQFVAGSSNSLLRAQYQLLQFLKKPFARFGRLPGKSATLTVEKTDATFNMNLVNQPISRLSKLIFDHCDLSTIVARRKSNYLFLQDNLAGLESLQPLVPKLPASVCPWVFPLFFKAREDACALLRCEGIPVVTWDGVRPAEFQSELFPEADFLYRNLVFLPVHQSLTPRDLREIVQAVKVVASAARSESCG